MSSLESCRPHIERIYQNLNAQHKQKMSDLHQRLSGIHVEKMTALRDRAKERIKTLKQTMTGGLGAQHHAALSNEVERVANAWRNREQNPGHLSTALGRLMDFHSSTLTGQSTSGRFANPAKTLDRFRGMQKMFLDFSKAKSQIKRSSNGK
jgi:hypothetical protein